MVKPCAVLQIKFAHKQYLLRRKYPYGLYKGVLPPRNLSSSTTSLQSVTARGQPYFFNYSNS